MVIHREEKGVSSVKEITERGQFDANTMQFLHGGFVQVGARCFI